MIGTADIMERLAWTSVQGLALVALALGFCRWRLLSAVAKTWICRLVWLRLLFGVVSGGALVFHYSTTYAAKGEAAPGRLPIEWLWQFLFAIWVVGVGFEFVHLFQRRRQAARMMAEAEPLSDCHEIARLSQRMGLERSPACGVHPSLSEPCVIGLARPRIMLPPHLDPAADPLAVAHELAHLKHGDVFWATLASFAQAAFWFLPGLSALLRETVLWQEARADAAARRAVGASPAEMARRVMAAVSTRPAFGLSFGAAETERRIRALFEPGTSRFAVVVGVLLVLATAIPIRIRSENGVPVRSRFDGELYQPVAAPIDPVRIASPAGS